MCRRGINELLVLKVKSSFSFEFILTANNPKLIRIIMYEFNFHLSFFCVVGLFKGKI